MLSVEAAVAVAVASAFFTFEHASAFRFQAGTGVVSSRTSRRGNRRNANDIEGRRRVILHNQMPFFATPAFGQPQQSGPASASPQSATVTLRLPLGTLFDGRDYIFVTESNVRGYEWTERETGIWGSELPCMFFGDDDLTSRTIADILLDDLMDAALGNLGGQLDNDDEPSLLTKPASMITDYELSQIVLVPSSW